MSNFMIDEETDLLAAEFVLGTLDSEERAHAHGLLRSDHGFIAMVRIWERRFGELHLMVEPVEPDAAILRRIKAKVVTLSVPETTTPEPKPVAEVAPPVTSSPPPSEPAAMPAPQMPKAANIELKPLQAAAEHAAANLKAIAASETLLTPDPAAAPPPDAVSPAAPSAAPTSVAGTPESAVSGAVAPATAPAAATPLEGVTPATFPPVAASSPQVSSPAEARPALELRPSEPVIKLDHEPVAKVNVPHAPLSAPRLPERFPERIQGRNAAREPEITIDVIRSRGRWRVLGILMSVLVVGLMALLASWRFAPDRLPGALRPDQFMTALGIGVPSPTAAPRALAPAAKPPPPAGQFDE